MGKDEFPALPPTKAECAGKQGVPTPRELRVLREMRAVKERVRQLKARRASVRAGQGAEEEIAAIEQDLAALRRRWEELEKERDAAAHERMVMLGHA